ncbi:hypothetical protein [Tenggerimyces flavus]|uniref:Uncharacterized protein n=1 Tax=Tenggerimyces flavus TaxID=1708749 RepID=A0ABV7YHI9_9ACTN|nr:hypothetical protein [Tenggerimyces flavus]MBM7784257.1 hypothetical protein [Tenggerimyces flavus]
MTEPSSLDTVLAGWATSVRLAADDVESMRRSIVARHDQPSGLPPQWWRTQGMQLANVFVQAHRQPVLAAAGWAA